MFTTGPELTAPDRAANDGGKQLLSSRTVGGRLINVLTASQHIHTDKFSYELKLKCILCKGDVTSKFCRI